MMNKLLLSGGTSSRSFVYKPRYKYLTNLINADRLKKRRLDMKKILIVSLVYCLLLVACAPKKVDPDYEGQRKRASEGFKELDKE